MLIPGTEAKIVQDDGTLAGPNEPGELWVKAPNVALGYWRNEKATAEAIRDGWFLTGDLVRVDEDGYFFLTGRNKELIKLQTLKKEREGKLTEILFQEQGMRACRKHDSRARRRLLWCIPMKTG